MSKTASTNSTKHANVAYKNVEQIIKTPREYTVSENVVYSGLLDVIKTDLYYGVRSIPTPQTILDLDTLTQVKQILDKTEKVMYPSWISPDNEDFGKKLNKALKIAFSGEHRRFTKIAEGLGNKGHIYAIYKTRVYNSNGSYQTVFIGFTRTRKQQEEYIERQTIVDTMYSQLTSLVLKIDRLVNEIDISRRQLTSANKNGDQRVVGMLLAKLGKLNPQHFEAVNEMKKLRRNIIDEIMVSVTEMLNNACYTTGSDAVSTKNARREIIITIGKITKSRLELLDRQPRQREEQVEYKEEYELDTIQEENEVINEQDSSLDEEDA